MKNERTSNGRWNLGMSALFLFLAALFVFAASVSVPFNAPAITFSQAWGSASLDHALKEMSGRDYPWIAGIFSGSLLIYLLVNSAWVRLGAMAVGCLFPAFAIGPVVWLCGVFAPVWIFSAMCLTWDGESYMEQMLMAGAVGLWSLACLAAAVREFLVIRKSVTSENEKAVPA